MEYYLLEIPDELVDFFTGYIDDVNPPEVVIVNMLKFAKTVLEHSAKSLWENP